MVKGVLSNIIDTPLVTHKQSSTLDYLKKTREELIAICKEKGIKGYSGKKKGEIVKLLSDKLNMIDLFAGTGAFTLAFQATDAVNIVFGNDMVEHSKKIYDDNFNHKLTLKNLNEVNVEDIPAHDILTGGFPCFVAGTRVMTQDGYKPIETVELTDRLLTHTGKFQSILNKQQKTGCVKVHSLEIQYHPHAIKCTEEHPFYASRRIASWNNSIRRYEYYYTDPKWITASQLTEEHYTGIPVDNQSIIPSSTIKYNGIIIDNYDQWFMMGYYLGNSKTSDAINSKIKYRMCATDLCKDFGKYANEKCIPEWVQTAPKECIEQFLLGYQTSKSCIKSHNIQYTTDSDNIAYGIQRLYLKVGKLCSVTYHPMTHRSTYKMRVLLQRPSASFIESSYAWFKVQSNTVLTTEPQTVYNFEVENDNSYCVENTIVHNCQPFSIAGLQEGFKDERSNVFWKILSIIDRHQPKCVILENVKNLVSHDETKTFTTIKSNLEKRGYHVCHKVLNTAEITGIPQHRERIYIVCMKSKKVFDRFSLDFPKIEKKKISEFLEKDVPLKYYYTDKSSTWDLVKTSVVKKDTIYQYRRTYVRENKSSECPTLTANMGSGGHNVPIIVDDVGIRKLTPRECFNLQGFPSTYKLPSLCDSNLYKLAGNAVSVPVVKLIANRIIPLLQGE